MPNIESVSFENEDGAKLSAHIEWPIDKHPHAYVLFAHCFTCGKNLSAVRNISRSLSLNGFAVMRFDFTGLGQSEGEFEDTNFSSNVQDLLVAADYLKEHYEAPQLLIGHSLGGAAVIVAASQLESVKAVTTIGAPADPEHVKELLTSSVEEIKKEGKAKVNIGGRPFTIKEQFLKDLDDQNMKTILADLNRSLLVMHSPQDSIVSIDNAAKIYKRARHPKSFITLDGADHLLSDKSDSQYAGDVIASWVKRYIPLPEKDPLKSEHELAVRLTKNDKFTTQVVAGNHSFVADEPKDVGGNNFGPTPYQLLSAGLGACTAMTLRMYADRKKWDLEEVVVHLNHDKRHAEEASECDENKDKVDHFERILEIEGDLDEKQRQRLLEIANKCPVHRSLKSRAEIKTVLQDEKSR